MLLPVVSLPNHVMGGPVAVITRDPLKHSMSPACQHSTQSDTLASVHVHELVVVGLSADDDESESSDTGESMSGLNSGADASSELSGSRLSHTNINPASAVEHMTTSMVDRATTSSAVDHSIDAMSGDECATSAPRVDQGGAPLCSSDHSLRDVSVIVQSALLARITALDKDNHQLRQKVTNQFVMRFAYVYCVHMATVNAASGIAHSGMLYIPLYMYMYTYICIYVYMYVHVYLSPTYMYMYMYMYIHVRTLPLWILSDVRYTTCAL